MTKTYTVTSTRQYSETKTRGTCRRDWVASMLEKYSEACTSYKTQMTPYRYEPQHAAEQSTIEEHQENTGLPGIEVSNKYIQGILEYDSTRVTATFDYPDNSVIQTLRVSGPIRTYEIHIDTNVVKWQLPE